MLFCVIIIIGMMCFKKAAEKKFLGKVSPKTTVGINDFPQKAL